jgi:hypothetical protein
LNDEYIIKPIPKELKVVMNVDSADGAFIGQDSDDADGSTSSRNVSMTKKPDLGKILLSHLMNSSGTGFTHHVNDTSAHYHIIYKRAASTAQFHPSSRTDISEDGFIMSETENLASVIPDHDYGRCKTHSRAPKADNKY